MPGLCKDIIVQLIVFIAPPTGPDSSCSPVHVHSVCLSGLPVADQNVSANIDTISADAHRDDRYTEITGHSVHAT